jgi:hypothetical protein
MYIGETAPADEQEAAPKGNGRQTRLRLLTSVKPANAPATKESA